ncbi:ABC transporter permease [Nocardioides mangrovicus]|uniref:ABC transporter permease n=1 Tax=Nocardioides mangrovicus TaxID=2478913 RepID=A0A3L8P4I9_9ACTN|nr:ABC transporter permease [Nocardioides mangrovicus]RLV49992.1 ABC transporter permease [Nocardioides mangrovicus]
MATTEQATEVVVEHQVVDAQPLRTRIGVGAFLVLLGVVSLWFLGLKLDGSAKAHLNKLVLPGLATGVVVGVVILALAGYQLARGFRRQQVGLVLGGSLLLFVVAFLTWVSAHGDGARVDLTGLLQNSIGLAVPLMLGAMAGVLCERSGVINVAIEGQMLAGAFGAALIGSVAGSWFGLVGAAVFGALIGAILAVFAIKYLVNQVVLGVVLNVFALGLTGFFYDAFMQQNTQALNTPKVFKPIDLPVLGDIPFIGPLLFQANIVVYLTYVIIVAVDVALFRTRWGLRTRAIGEHPKAADTVGIKVLAMRYRNVIIGGAIAGIGGAYFTVGSVGAFGKNITSGNGFIALAALIFGRWSPRGAVAASLLFGFASALQTLLSFTVPGIPSNFLAMLPYVATILAVAGLVGRVRAPAADGEPYVAR